MKRKRTSAGCPARSGTCIIHFEEISPTGPFRFLFNVQDPDAGLRFLLDIKERRLREPVGSSYRHAAACSQLPTERTGDSGYHDICYKKVHRYS